LQNSLSNQLCSGGIEHELTDFPSLDRTRREKEIVWTRFTGLQNLDPNDQNIEEIQQPVFIAWWKGYRRRMQREMISWSRKRFKVCAHLREIEAQISGRLATRQAVRVISAAEMGKLIGLIQKQFKWIELSPPFSEDDFEAAHYIQ
jgi:hypothetical protein